jgi:drug/metabolite transporter (DMT)-like permease
VLGGFLALLTAATFAFNNACARRAVLSGTVIQGLMITVPYGVPFFLLAALVSGTLGQLFAMSQGAAIWFALAGVTHFACARYCTYRSHGAIGATLAAPVSQFDMVITLALALLVLGESLTPVRIFAILLLIAGPGIARHNPSSEGDGKPDKAKPKFEPRLTEGYFYAALTALFLGVSPIFVRLGMQEIGTAGSFVGPLVSYIAATVVVVGLVLATGQLRHAMAVPREAVKWFNLAGFTVCCAHAFRYAAFALVPVTVAAPIMRLSHVFRIFFAWLINRDYEIMTPRVLLGTAVSLAGALLISLDTELIIRMLSLPESAANVLRWRWPG